MNNLDRMSWMRAATEVVVRIQLLALAPLLLLLIGLGATRGGAWFAVLPPAALLLTAQVRVVARMGLRDCLATLGNVSMVAAVTAIAVFVVGPLFGFYRTVTVLSGSMRPTFNPGDMIVVFPEPAQNLRVGDAITFRVPVAGSPVETHRVVSITQPGSEPIVQTQGDANNTVDPWHAELHGGTVWRYRFRLPGFGYPLLALRSPWAHWATTLLLPALLLLWGLKRLWLPPRLPVLVDG